MSGKVKVIVSLRNGVLDPQGQAINETLGRMGYDFVKDVRVSKQFEITVDGDRKIIEKKVEEFSKNLLANPIIESFKIVWE